MKVFIVQCELPIDLTNCDNVNTFKKRLAINHINEWSCFQDFSCKMHKQKSGTFYYFTQ